MELTVQNVYGLLIRSKLLSLDECKDLFARWHAEAGENGDNLALFARWTVARSYLTEYQAALLARGYSDSFFLGGYKILDRLGRGRMAGVYKARHETGPVVAVKVLPPSKAKDPALLARFRREARLARKLKHPNIVRTFQVGENVRSGTAGRLDYLVMEYLEGETLDEVLARRGQFPPGEAVRLVHQALLGLQHLHEHDLIHRDLKPANLMLAYPHGAGPRADTLRATVKIIDMGLARALSDETPADPDRPEQAHLTSEGIVLGTPDYMAPEQAQDARAADIRSDIYSLGCVLYHLLAGQPPFPDTNIISQMIRHATELPRPLKELNAAVPDGLQQIVSWMLAKDPAQRYPTPARAAQALQMFLESEAEPAAAPKSDPRMKNYLTWLEDDTRAEEKKTKAAPWPAANLASRGPAAATAPVKPALALPVAPARPSSPGGPKSKHGGKKKGKKGRKSSSGTRLPTAKVRPPTSDPLRIDVELVAVPPPGAYGPQRLFSLPLSRRDFFMFAVGILTVALGAGLGFAGAWLSGSLDRPPPEQVRDE